MHKDQFHEGQPVLPPDFYYKLFNSIDLGFHVVEFIYGEGELPIDYRCLQSNEAFEQQTGLGNVVGKLGSDIVPGIERSWMESYHQILQSGGAMRFEDYNAYTSRWYEVYATRVGDLGSRKIALVFSDITLRKRVQARQSFLLELSDRLRPLSKVADIQATVTELARHYFGVDRCYYAEIIGDQAVVRMDAAADGLNSVAGTYALNTMPIYSQLLSKGKPFVAADTTKTDLLDEHLRQMAINLQIGSFVNVPVIKKGEAVGILCFTNRSPRYWDEFDVEVAEEIAQRISQAIEIANVHAALRLAEERHVAQLEAQVRKRTDQLLKLREQQQSEVFRTSLEALEEERHRIAESLHNGVGQLLYSAKLALANLDRYADVEALAHGLSQSSELLSEAIRETRRVSHELMPTILEKFGLQEALKFMCDKLQTASLKVSCKVMGYDGRLEKYMKLAVYRIMQELVVNVIKHADASQLDLLLLIHMKMILIKAEDNGKGMDMELQQDGVGLTAMRSKIRLLNGELSIVSGKGRGTRIEVAIPLHQKSS